jgi:hypothetical protein
MFVEAILLPFLLFKIFYFLEEGGDRGNRCSLSEGKQSGSTNGKNCEKGDFHKNED